MMSAREWAENMVELVDRGDGCQSMRLKGQSNLLWHSADKELMEIRRKEMVDTIAKGIDEAVIEWVANMMSR